MEFVQRHTFVLLALLGYLLGSVLIEVTHHDAQHVLSHSQPVLEAHTCGANEIHVAWEDARHCVACSHITQRISTELHPFSVGDVSTFTLIPLTTHNEQTFDADVLYSGKRGPPRA